MLNDVNIQVMKGNVHVDKTSPIQARQFEGVQKNDANAVVLFNPVTLCNLCNAVVKLFRIGVRDQMLNEDYTDD